MIWHCRERAGPGEDTRIQACLLALDPSIPWSVKNQARMHRRNGDAPYASSTDAMRFWPETATAVAVRRTAANRLEIAAPFGLDDLFNLSIRPTPAFAGAKRSIVTQRIRDKQWREQWPLLRIEPSITGAGQTACSPAHRS